MRRTSRVISCLMTWTAVAGHAQTPATEPVAVRSLDGCSTLILNPNAAPGGPEVHHRVAAAIERSTWTGGCKNGLYHGEGRLRVQAGDTLIAWESVWYFNGRQNITAPRAWRLSDGKLSVAVNAAHFSQVNLDAEGMPRLGAELSPPRVVLKPEGTKRSVIYQFQVPATISMVSIGEGQGEHVNESWPHESTQEAMSTWRQRVVPALQAVMAQDRAELERVSAQMAEARAWADKAKQAAAAKP